MRDVLDGQCNGIGFGTGMTEITTCLLVASCPWHRHYSQCLVVAVQYDSILNEDVIRVNLEILRKKSIETKRHEVL